MVGHDLGLVVVAPRATSGPPLELDFVQGRHRRGSESVAVFTALSGTGFSRTGAGTALTTAGALASFATGLPRITDRGMLLEGAATNLILQGRSPESAVWTKRGTATAVADMAVARADGTLGAVRLAGIASGAGGDAYQQVTATSGQRCEPQFWVNKISPTGTLMFCNSAYDLAGAWSINLALVAGGWQRITRDHPAVTIVYEFTVSGSNIGLHFRNLSATAISVYVDFTGIEYGTASTSPIVTAGAAATRGADAASVVVPAGCSTWSATYGVSNTVAGGSVTPGATFDLVAGRPWIGVGKELKRLTMG